jgi:hypothetical protein
MITRMYYRASTDVVTELSAATAFELLIERVSELRVVALPLALWRLV